MTLPAGTYTFRIMDSNTNRNIVQVFNQDGTKLLTTLLAIPATRQEPSGDPVILFKETASTQAPALHYWYYAGDTAGNELVYPKSQAQQIANASGESVMAVDSTGTTIDDMKSGSVSRVSPDNAAPAPQSAAPQPAPAPEPKPAAPALDQSTPAPAASAPAESLPKTASEMPLIGLVGLLALSAALALRVARAS